MVATFEEIEVLEEWFAKAVLPENLQLNRAEKINDLPTYVSTVINNLKNSTISDTVLRPRYDDLLHIKLILSGGTSQKHSG